MIFILFMVVSKYVTDDTDLPNMTVTDDSTVHITEAGDDSSSSVGLYVGISVAVVFLLITLTTLITVVVVIKKKQGERSQFSLILVIMLLLHLVHQ